MTLEMNLPKPRELTTLELLDLEIKAFQDRIAVFVDEFIIPVEGDLKIGKAAYSEQWEKFQAEMNAMKAKLADMQNELARRRSEFEAMKDELASKQ